MGVSINKVKTALQLAGIAFQERGPFLTIAETDLPMWRTAMANQRPYLAWLDRDPRVSATFVSSTQIGWRFHFGSVAFDPVNAVARVNALASKVKTRITMDRRLPVEFLSPTDEYQEGTGFYSYYQQYLDAVGHRVKAMTVGPRVRLCVEHPLDYAHDLAEPAFGGWDANGDPVYVHSAGGALMSVPTAVDRLQGGNGSPVAKPHKLSDVTINGTELVTFMPDSQAAISTQRFRSIDGLINLVAVYGPPCVTWAEWHPADVYMAYCANVDSAAYMSSAAEKLQGAAKINAKNNALKLAAKDGGVYYMRGYDTTVSPFNYWSETSMNVDYIHDNPGMAFGDVKVSDALARWASGEHFFSTSGGISYAGLSELEGSIWMVQLKYSLDKYEWAKTGGDEVLDLDLSSSKSFAKLLGRSGATVTIPSSPGLLPTVGTNDIALRNAHAHWSKAAELCSIAAAAKTAATTSDVVTDTFDDTTGRALIGGLGVKTHDCSMGRSLMDVVFIDTF